MRLALVLVTLLGAACFGPLYDDVDPLAGQLGICCNTDSFTLGEHLTVPGERATSQFFPACSCFEGPECVIHKPLAGGKCYGLSGGGGGQDAGAIFPGVDSGVVFPTLDAGFQPADSGVQPSPDAGSQPPLPDAGSAGDAGSAPSDAGGVGDAGSAPSDAGTPVFDAGAPLPDAGFVSPDADAGTTVDSGVLDAGVSPTGPPSWSVCCIGSRITTCLCPTSGSCAEAEFHLCGSLTCTLDDVCPRYP